MDYLERNIPGYNFEIIPVNNDNIALHIDSGTVDFVLTNPGSYVRLERDKQIYRIATLIRRQPSGPQSRFGAIIFTRADHPEIHSLKDLEGKVFMGIHPDGFGGWQMAWREIRDAGLDPYTDFRSLRFSGFPQKGVFDAVLSGEVDAGTVRTSQLERLIKRGEVAKEDIRILNPRRFKHLHVQRIAEDRLAVKAFPQRIKSVFVLIDHHHIM